MKIFSILKKGEDSQKAISVSFLASPNELRKLARFFEESANRMEPYMTGHVHLQDFYKELQTVISSGAEPDVIIYCSNELAMPTKAAVPKKN